MRVQFLAVAAGLLAASPALAQPAATPLPAPPAQTSHDALGPGGDHAAPPGALKQLQEREQSLLQDIDRSGSEDGLRTLDAIRAEQDRLAAAHGGGLTQTDHRYLTARLDELALRLGLPGA